MSTKIYNGYRSKVSFQQTYKALVKFRSQAVPLFENHARSRMAYIAVSSCLRHKLGLSSRVMDDPKDKQSFLMHAWDRVKERYRHIYASDRRDPAYDFDAQIAVFPLGEDTLMRLTLESGAFPDVLALWESIPQFEEFGYWNNTDQPEGISDLEWEKRGMIWDKVYDDSYNYLGPHGLEFRVTGRYAIPVPIKRDIEPLLPDILANPVLYEDIAVDILLKRNKQHDILAKDPGDISGMLKAINDAKKSPEIADAIKEAKSVNLAVGDLV